MRSRAIIPPLLDSQTANLVAQIRSLNFACQTSDEQRQLWGQLIHHKQQHQLNHQHTAKH